MESTDLYLAQVAQMVVTMLSSSKTPKPLKDFLLHFDPEDAPDKEPAHRQMKRVLMGAFKGAKKQADKEERRKKIQDAKHKKVVKKHKRQRR